ncbi:MAG: VWA domain-containing protein [Bacteroidales bacterium]|nr:VWA domain-containing protein [Bacteroidales bacterium]MBQ2090679.1 VWA domain-containing protein [Bacteroidales bacterium]
MNIYNVIILDESGSMSSIYRPTIQSMNEVISGIRKNQKEFPDQRHYVTIVTFEGNGPDGIKTRRDRVPIQTVEDFTDMDYCPGGCTPLYDAMGITLNHLESVILPEDKVMATVITDGYENSSREYSGNTIKALVSRLRAKGWVLAYIGANQDAVEVARELNIKNALNFEATPDGMSETAVRFKSAARKMAAAVNYCQDTGALDHLFEEDKK